jgi:hypothetical protein
MTPPNSAATENGANEYARSLVAITLDAAAKRNWPNWYASNVAAASEAVRAVVVAIGYENVPVTTLSGA